MGLEDPSDKIEEAQADYEEMEAIMAFTRNMLIATINSTEVFHELSMKHVARLQRARDTTEAKIHEQEEKENTAVHSSFINAATIE